MIWGALVVGLTFGLLPAAAQSTSGDITEGMNIPDVVAKVNGVELKSDYVKLRMNLDARSLRRELTLNEKLKLAQDIIEKEVVRELIYQEGRVNVDPIPPAIIRGELEKLKKNYKNPTEFQKSLDARNIREMDLLKTIETDLLAQQLLDRQVRGKVTIKDDQVKNFYDGNKERFHRPESFKVQHIFVPFVPLEVVQKTSREELEKDLDKFNKEAEAEIKKIQGEVKAGGDFGELAKKHSQDAESAPKGGDLGFMYKGVLDPAFDETVSKMKVGDVSDVIKTRFGYHLVKLNETRPDDYAPFKDVKPEIQKFLFMKEAQKLVGKYIETLRKQSKVEVFY